MFIIVTYLFLVEEYVDNPNHSNPLVVEITPNIIHDAHLRLIGGITDILATKNFKKLRRACYQEISAPSSSLPTSLVKELKDTNTLDDMLDVLALSPYWNWFDTRLLQALVSASGSPEAEMMVEQFKQIYYAHKVSEVLPCVIVRPTEDSVILTEKFDKDPKELTLLDLLKHKQILEYEVMDIGENKIRLSCIRTGCVELIWEVPLDLVHQAYISIKKNQDKFSSLAVESLICEEADEYAGLPILWRGQEVGEVGPIKPLPEHVRQEPYSIPQGFHWVALSSSDAKEVVKVLNNTEFDSCFINFLTKHPNTRNEWWFGIRTTSGKLVALALAFPVCVSIGGVSVTCMKPLMSHHPKYNGKRMFYVLVKELMRRANLYNINYQLMYKHLFKPIATVYVWKYNFTNSQLPSSPRAPDWRRMTSEDVPSALALINKWSSQFEIRQVFNSEEEFAHNFLCSILPNYVYTYVVEDEVKNITDLVSFTLVDKKFMKFTIKVVASMQIPIKQLLIDAIVCAKDLGAKVLSIKDFHINPEVLSSLSFHCLGPGYIAMYNYRYTNADKRVWIAMHNFCNNYLISVS